MSDAKRAEREPTGALPMEEMPTGEGTETLEIERPPVRIGFPGDVANGRGPWRRSVRPSPAQAEPGRRDSSGGQVPGPGPGLHLLQIAWVPETRKGR
jgi:hypothetical protein